MRSEQDIKDRITLSEKRLAQAIKDNSILRIARLEAELEVLNWIIKN